MLSPFSEKAYVGKISYGLGPASYDIRVDQDIKLWPFGFERFFSFYPNPSVPTPLFCLASSMEKFTMPNDVAATVHDKSTWARLGLAVQTTFIDPGWNGYLTL